MVRDEYGRSYKKAPATDSTISNAEGETGSEMVCHVPALVLPLHVLADNFHMQTTNIFDSLPVICAPKVTDLRDELDSYLSTDPEHTADALLWWAERKHVYPSLSRMALDYLSIPGMSLIL